MDDAVATVLVDKYRQAATVDSDHKNQYKGLHIHALEGLHEAVARHLLKVAPPNKTLLDLAAGSGALGLRLSDHGYAVTATDIVDENFRLKGKIPFIGADLNSNFADRFDQHFDVISAVEIIEHIENPRHFFRQCAALLNPQGVLLVSTPNINSPVSQALSIRLGHFQWFTDADYHSEGHINPVSPSLMMKCALETGFQAILQNSHGSPFRALQNWPKMCLLAKVIGALSATPKHLRGECYIAVFQQGRALSDTIVGRTSG